MNFNKLAEAIVHVIGNVGQRPDLKEAQDLQTKMIVSLCELVQRESRDELASTIKCIHALWYNDPLSDPERAIALHSHLEVLFNWANITDTLCENNPGEITPDQVKQMIKAKKIITASDPYLLDKIRIPSDWDHHWETPEEMKERDERVLKKP